MTKYLLHRWKKNVCSLCIHKCCIEFYGVFKGVGKNMFNLIRLVIAKLHCTIHKTIIYLNFPYITCQNLKKSTKHWVKLYNIISKAFKMLSAIKFILDILIVKAYFSIDTF